MVRTDKEICRPLPAAQLGIWFAQKIDPTNPSYYIAGSIEIHGPVDPALFEAAFLQAAQDTEAFRLGYFHDSEGPQQFTASGAGWLLPLVDVSAEPDPQAAAENWMKADLGQRVDFLRSPLWTSALLKAAPDRFVWYHRTHHILMDGFSGPLFARRIADVYTALVNGLSPGANPFGSSSSLLEDDAASRASERFARDRQYWLECLADRPDVASLSGRPPATSSRFLRQTAHLQSASVGALRTVAQRVGVSLPQLIIAAVAAYVHRLTGAQDLVLGLPVTGRSGALARRVPGMPPNVVPLRLAVQPGMSILLPKIREHLS